MSTKHMKRGCGRHKYLQSLFKSKVKCVGDCDKLFLKSLTRDVIKQFCDDPTRPIVSASEVCAFNRRIDLVLIIPKKCIMLVEYKTTTSSYVDRVPSNFKKQILDTHGKFIDKYFNGRRRHNGNDETIPIVSVLVYRKSSKPFKDVSTVIKTDYVFTRDMSRLTMWTQKMLNDYKPVYVEL